MKSKAIHTEVPACQFLDDGVFATKSGEAGIVLRLQPRDSECMEAADMEATARRFEAAMRLIEPGCRIYQYLIKRHLGSVKGDRRRAAYLESKSLYLFEIYLVIMRTGLQVEAIRQIAAALIVQLGSTLPAQVQDKAGVFDLFRKLLNYDPEIASSVNWNDSRPYIDYYSGDSPIEVHRRHLVVGGHIARILFLKDPPLSTHPDVFRSLREIPSECIVVSEWKPVEMQTIRSTIMSKTSHFHKAKIASSMGYALINVVLRLMGSSQADGKERPEDMQKDESATAMENQLGELVADIEKNGTMVGEFSLTVILLGTDEPAVNRSVSEAVKAASEKEAILVQETHNCLPAWLACIPGNHQHQRRAMYLTNHNYADVSMLFAPDTGNVRNEHLNAECLAVLETRQQTPYYGNLHYQDVGHALISGQTGSGKSFLSAHLLNCARSRYNPRILIFDIGGSYKKLTHEVGGSYMEIGLKHDFTINPFSLPETEENRHFLFSFTKVLIESGQHRMDDVEQDLLYRAIPGTKRLCELPEKLPAELRPFLSRWTGTGQYGCIFDNEAETLTCARFQTYDFEGLEKFPQILQPLLFYVLHRANAEIYDNAMRSEFKIFLLDESWKFLENNTVRQYIYESLKTWRKRNAAMWLATQSIGDLDQAKMLETVAENCGSIVLLPNPRMNRDEYRKIFKLNDRELDEVVNMRPKAESLWKTGTQVGKVLVLDLGGAA